MSLYCREGVFIINKRIGALLVKPGEKPEDIETQNIIATLNSVFECDVEYIRPGNDGVVLILNNHPEGLILNRSIVIDKKQNIIAGDFMVCYSPDNSTFEDFPENIYYQYREKFAVPEVFKITTKGIESLKK